MVCFFALLWYVNMAVHKHSSYFKEKLKDAEPCTAWKQLRCICVPAIFRSTDCRNNRAASGFEISKL